MSALPGARRAGTAKAVVPSSSFHITRLLSLLPPPPNSQQLVTVMREQYKVEDSEFFAFWRFLCQLLRTLGCFLGTVDAHIAREALAP